MKTYQVTKREGEYLGPVDWDYDFAQHFNCTPESHRAKRCAEAIEILRSLDSSGEWQATTDGGWPRVGWGEVLKVGMYDGWPFWKPTPSVAISGHFGTSWHPFSSITSIEKLKPKAS